MGSSARLQRCQERQQGSPNSGGSQKGCSWPNGSSSPFENYSQSRWKDLNPRLLSTPGRYPGRGFWALSKAMGSIGSARPSSSRNAHREMAPLGDRLPFPASMGSASVPKPYRFTFSFCMWALATEKGLCLREQHTLGVTTPSWGSAVPWPRRHGMSFPAHKTFLPTHGKKYGQAPWVAGDLLTWQEDVRAPFLLSYFIFASLHPRAGSEYIAFGGGLKLINHLHWVGRVLSQMAAHRHLTW